jgi:small subunit ribosomal protein S16
MLKIRLQRTGRKHQPTYRLVLTDSKNSSKSGKYLEVLGNYDSRSGEKSEFKSERIIHWIKNGAQVSDTVHNLLVDKKITTGKKINKLPLKKAIIKDKPAEAEVSTPAPAPVETEVAPESAETIA